jgi:hypothetical protein
VSSVDEVVARLEGLGQHAAAKVLRDTVLKQQADARALWAVRVLDAASTDTRAFRTRPTGATPGDQFEPFITAEVLWSDVRGLWLSRGAWEGQSADAARLAAAEAVFPTLDADVRATLGERP